MNVIAGSRCARSSEIRVEGRDSRRTRGARFHEREPRPPRIPESPVAATSSGLSLPLPVGAYRSKISSPTIMCWYSGTGRFSETMISQEERTSRIHAPNSSAFDTVADKAMMATCAGR